MGYGAWWTFDPGDAPMKDRFPLVVGVLVVAILVLAACGLNNRSSAPAERGPAAGAPVMYEFSTGT
jgi:hypothetical protein